MLLTLSFQTQNPAQNQTSNAKLKNVLYTRVPALHLPSLMFQFTLPQTGIWRWKSTIREDLFNKISASSAKANNKRFHRLSRSLRMTCVRANWLLFHLRSPTPKEQTNSYGSITPKSGITVNGKRSQWQLPVTSSPPPKSVPSRLAIFGTNAVLQRLIQILLLEQVHMLRLTQNQPGSRLSTHHLLMDWTIKSSVLSAPTMQARKRVPHCIRLCKQTSARKPSAIAKQHSRKKRGLLRTLNLLIA